MAFTLPTFNLTCNVWNQPAVPPAARTFQVPCNLAYGKRVQVAGVDAVPTIFTFVVQLLFPAHTDVRSAVQQATGDNLEIPAGSGRFYRVMIVEDAGKGFTNEHRVVVARQTTDFGLWPIPMP